MLEIRGDLNLRLESIDTNDRAKVGTQHLERDLAIVPEIAREVDLRHPALTHEAIDGVATSESGSEGVGREHEPSTGKARTKLRSPPTNR